MAFGPQVRFDRQCFVTVAESPPGTFQKQVRGYDDQALIPGGLRIAFKVERKLTPVADTAVVRIWNLSAESRAALAQRSIYITRRDPVRMVQLHAGYRGNVGAIFNGAVVRVTNSRQGPDWITEIEGSAVAAHAFNVVKMGEGSAAGTPLRTVLDRLFTAFGVGRADYSPEALEVASSTLLDTVHAEGSAYDALRRLVAAAGLTFTVDVDGAHVVKPGYPKNWRSIVFVDELTGLIGTPKVEDTGIQFRALMDKALTPGQLLTVLSQTVAESTPGLGRKFTAWEVVNTGDTHGDDWYSDVHALHYPPVVEIGAPIGARLPLIPQAAP